MKTVREMLNDFSQNCPREPNISGWKTARLCPLPDNSDQTTRAEDAALQVSGLSPAIPQHYAAIYNTFYVQPHLISRPTLRRFRGEAQTAWRAATAAACAEEGRELCWPGAVNLTTLFGYIEGFYDPHRLHSTLGYISPA